MYSNVALSIYEKKLRRSGVSEDEIQKLIALAKKNSTGSQYVPVGLQDDSQDGQENGREDDQEDDQEDYQQEEDNSQDDQLDYKKELQRLRQENASLQGRLAPSQRDIEDYRRLVALKEQEHLQEKAAMAARMAELEQRLEERELTELDIEELFPEDVRQEIDPKLLNAIVQASGKIAKKQARPAADVKAEVDKILRERSLQEAQTYRDSLLTNVQRPIYQIKDLYADPEFQAWCTEDDNEVEDALSSLLNATNKDQIDRYVRIVERKVEKFNKSKKAANKKSQPNSDPSVRLRQGMRRNVDKSFKSTQETEAILAKVKQLSRSHSSADRAKAKELMASLK